MIKNQAQELILHPVENLSQIALRKTDEIRNALSRFPNPWDAFDPCLGSKWAVRPNWSNNFEHFRRMYRLRKDTDIVFALHGSN